MEALLPTKSRQILTNPISLVYLAISEPKWGKTTFFCNIPGALLIAFERGFAFQGCPTVFIVKWHDPKFEPYVDKDGVMYMTMTQLEEVLVASDKYSFLIFDTADMAAKKCSDYYLKKHRATHADDLGDYGRGYDIVQNTPFRQMVGSLMGTGRGIAFTTHRQLQETKAKKGTTIKKATSLPGGVYKFLHSQADVILHGHFGKKQKGNDYRDRIWQTEGDEETLAGSRANIKLPSKYVVDPKRPWAQWCEFFTDPEAAREADITLGDDDDEEEEEEDMPVKKKVVKKTLAKSRR